MALLAGFNFYGKPKSDLCPMAQLFGINGQLSRPNNIYHGLQQAVAYINVIY